MEKQTATAEITKEDAYKGFQDLLKNDPKLLQQKMKSFEVAFGKNTATRTKKQWCNLVRVYGIDSVCQNEKMTPEIVNRHCNETFSQRLNRINKQK